MIYYANGESIAMGDIVRLSDDMGEVVAIIEEGLYSKKFPGSDWSGLQNGFLVECKQYGLIHYLDAEQDLFLVRRQGTE